MTTHNNNSGLSLEERVTILEHELVACGLEKDSRIEAMHNVMKTVHSDMGAMKNTIESLTQEIRSAVQSLREIATNTASMGEISMLYDKWKGFAWVMKNIGFWGAIIVAFIIGVIATTIKMG